MNFLQACEELRAGRCETISRPGGICRFETYRDFGMKNVGLDIGRIDVEHFRAYDWQLVNPKPVMETVEVKVWLSLLNGDCKQSHMITADEMQSGHWIEMTGTYPKPIKEKVKHREEMPRDSFRAGYQSIHPTAQFYAEWYTE